MNGTAVLDDPKPKLLSPSVQESHPFDPRDEVPVTSPQSRTFPVPVRWIKILLDDAASRAVTAGADLTLVLRNAPGEERRVHPLDFYALDDKGDVIVDKAIIDFVVKNAKSLPPDA